MSAQPAWARAICAQAQCPPAAPRVPLWLGDERVGSVQAGFLERYGVLARLDGRCPLALQQRAGASAWVLPLQGATQALAALAQALRSAGCCGPWRDEQITVRGNAGQALATVERGAVRVLGMATEAVHLVGTSADGARLWLQQRAQTKPTHPGRWDTLMGGMVGAGESPDQALERETWEEAGLQLAQLQQLRMGGVVDFAHPCGEGGGAGYLIERITWYAAAVPEGVAPHNRDGEVQGFACLVHDQVQDWLAHERFTPEAARVLVDFYGW
ncbi:NUDIX domain-containing protein [Comamonas faecalis]|uniref:NUDIX domain-containing protein n=1 Tax=Comamonas faecalis TaxID=1387849 RepID=UPI000C9F4F1C